MVVTLLGLVAQPVAAENSGAPNLPSATGSSQLDRTLVDIGSQDALVARLEPSYQWNSVGVGQPATQLLPDEPTSWARAAGQIALGLLMLLLVVAGFTIAIKSLRADIRQRRVVYLRRVRM